MHIVFFIIFFLKAEVHVLIRVSQILPNVPFHSRVPSITRHAFSHHVSLGSS